MYCKDVAPDRGYEVLTTHAVNAPRYGVNVASWPLLMDGSVTRSYATIKVVYMTVQYNGFRPSYRCCEYVAQYIANGPWWYVNAPQFHYRAMPLHSAVLLDTVPIQWTGCRVILTGTVHLKRHRPS